MDTRERLDDLLDRLVAEYSDGLAAGRRPIRADYLARVDPSARPGLERCLKMIEAGLAAMPAGLMPLIQDAQFGRYVLKREIGRGGMAIVWLAFDPELERPVALKILRPGLAIEVKHTDRFRREALAVAKLQHPNIVQIHDVGEECGYQYLAMEFVEGPSLATVLEAVDTQRYSADELRRAAGAPALARGMLGFEQAMAHLLMQVADALSAAHDKGLVHRDIKPSNILLRSDGTAVVADFGLALSEGDPALSMTGDTLGTPYYMSPEQAQLSETKVDHRTDVYSLGVTLFEALSGARPFEGGSALEVFEAIKTHLPRSLQSYEKRVTKQAGAVVRMAMAHDPEQRYESAADFKEDLHALANGSPVRAWKKHGGILRRLWAELQWMSSGIPYEYKTSTTFLGLPLVHVYSGRRYPGQKWRVAKGWIAYGEVACGGICAGGASVGVISFGGISAGLLCSMGGISAALGVSAGGISMAGLASTGGISLALWLAIGGIARGYAAIGGHARGTYAMGGNADGEYVISETRQDMTEEEWWNGALSPMWEFLGSVFGVS
ncbi:MAG: serine/threonine protein kinase [Planctomycetota bacterium]|jgi:serine/threonine protein kinase